MDLGFLRRAEARLATRSAAHPDFGMLVAALASQQAGTAAARASARRSAVTAMADPIVELLLAGPRWPEARAAQRGVFHAGLARQRAVN